MKRYYERGDGTSYVFDEELYQSTKKRVETALYNLAGIPEVLSRYEDTEEGSKSPEYVRGILTGGGFAFVKSDRERKIRESLKGVPFGRTTLDKMIRETLEEIPGSLESELDLIFSRYSADKEYLRFPDIELTTDSETGEVVLTLPGDFFDKLQKSMEIEIPEDYKKDLERLSQAVRILWELEDEGYFLGEGLRFGDILPVCGVVSSFLGKYTDEARGGLLSPAYLLDKLRKDPRRRDEALKQAERKRQRESREATTQETQEQGNE